MGVAWGLEQTKYFTLGCDDLLVVTDHKPLVKILGDRTLDEITIPGILISFTSLGNLIKQQMLHLDTHPYPLIQELHLWSCPQIMTRQNMHWMLLFHMKPWRLHQSNGMTFHQILHQTLSFPKFLSRLRKDFHLSVKHMKQVWYHFGVYVIHFTLEIKMYWCMVTGS